MTKVILQVERQIVVNTTEEWHVDFLPKNWDELDAAARFEHVIANGDMHDLVDDQEVETLAVYSVGPFEDFATETDLI